MKIAYPLAILLLLSLVYGQVTELEDNFFANNTIIAAVNAPEEINFTSPSTTLKFDISIKNNYSEPLEVYLAYKTNSKWRISKKIGTVMPNEYKTFATELFFQYNGTSVEKTNLALISPGEPPKGYAFSITQNWLNYETQVKTILLNSSAIAIPILALGVAAILIYITELAYATKTSRGISGDEYNLRTLFFPLLRGRPFLEKVADIVINPIFWAVEILTALIIVYIIREHSLAKLGLGLGDQVFALALFSAILMPFIYVALIWLAQRYYEKEPLRFTTSMFLWGLLAAFCAYILNSLTTALLPQLGDGISKTTIVIITVGLSAPIIEELLKGVGILIAAGHHELDSTFNGLTYGFACGVGFSIIENLFYFASHINPFETGLAGWLVLIIQRSILNSLAHGCFTATTGAIIGFIKSRPETSKYTYISFLPAVFIAIVLHSSFNLSAILDSYAVLNLHFPVFLFNPLLVLVLSSSFLIVFILSALEINQKKISKIAQSKLA
ncbi:PrsW family intramembrane metalloprotease [Candidatus Micrarchaeota archaeon]|nr:PrsW family intramembrane metalloprotease [Candidatus Micrarchaeota archaeon]